ncbi:uncharacterized protein BDR25DRAFT_353659 [Lindgomyces ingoldianus]|uniref:Uncharacterized protein n=1 Tax=Lindgomyces ingoldianus TaxID=673940 RepID=A0ACB6R2S1_9PLEO|nr:uncharacterized protein BDR25DRAFT_353659 [Lindgomyces ingoldianus]KAF2472625.1 hypothetical protein BDR25DRAFT_353659 [Lindgomyces ingoldianus]
MRCASEVLDTVETKGEFEVSNVIHEIGHMDAEKRMRLMVMSAADQISLARMELLDRYQTRPCWLFYLAKYGVGKGGKYAADVQVAETARLLFEVKKSVLESWAVLIGARGRASPQHMYHLLYLFSKTIQIPCQNHRVIIQAFPESSRWIWICKLCSNGSHDEMKYESSGLCSMFFIQHCDENLLSTRIELVGFEHDIVGLAVHFLARTENAGFYGAFYRINLSWNICELLDYEIELAKNHLVDSVANLCRNFWIVGLLSWRWIDSDVRQGNLKVNPGSDHLQPLTVPHDRFV